MDPKLMAALKSLLEARKNAREVGESIAPSDEDAFIKRETGGKYSRKDLEPLLATSGSNLVRSMMNGATMHLADNVIGMFSPQQADESRLRSDYYEQEHPLRAAAGDIAGAVATGHAFTGLFGAGEGANTIVQTAKAGAKAGAGYGAADAFGRADGKPVSEKIDAAAGGAVMGGAAGGLLSGALGAGAAMVSPERHAIGRIAHAIEKDGGLQALQTKLGEFVKAGRGDVVTMADLGPHLRQALDFAANASDDVLVPAAELIEARTSNRAARLLSDVRANLGAPASLMNPSAALPAAAARSGEPDAGLRALQLAGNTSKVGQGYDALAEQNPSFDVSSLPLDKPRIARLWAQARAAGNLSAKGPLDDLIAKITANNPSIGREQAQEAAQAIASAQAKDAGAAMPSMERGVTLADLQQLRRGVKGQADAAWRAGNGEMGKALGGIQTHVDDVLEAGAPGFQAQNAAYKGARDLERGLDAGHDWWKMADHRELARKVASLKSQPGALDEFRRGIASGLVEDLQAAATNRDKARELMQGSEDLDAKLKLIFGDKNSFGSFMARAKAERELGKLSSTVGGSQTARRTAGQQLDPEHAGLDLALHGPGMIKSALGQLAKMAMTKRVASQMGPSLLTQGAPSIEQLFSTMGQQPHLAGAGITTLGPMGLMSLFNNH